MHPNDIFIYLKCIKLFMKTKQISIQHSPTLNTVLMVEKALQEAGGLIKVSELKQRLPRMVMHGTVLQILDYLQGSGKILVTTKGVVWIYQPPAELERLKAGGLEL